MGHPSTLTCFRLSTISGHTSCQAARIHPSLRRQRGRSMSRKSVLLGIGIFMLLVGCAAGGLVALLHHEPEFYRRSTVPPGDVRVKGSVEFEQRFTQLLGDLQGDQRWVASFTDEQLNCYFEEGFRRSRLDETMLPEGISSPRIGIEPDKMRL